jgi:hypothetical protein
MRSVFIVALATCLFCGIANSLLLPKDVALELLQAPKVAQETKADTPNFASCARPDVQDVTAVIRKTYPSFSCESAFTQVASIYLG